MMSNNPLHRTIQQNKQLEVVGLQIARKGNILGGLMKTATLHDVNQQYEKWSEISSRIIKTGNLLSKLMKQELSTNLDTPKDKLEEVSKMIISLSKSSYELINSEKVDETEVSPSNQSKFNESFQQNILDIQKDTDINSLGLWEVLNENSRKVIDQYNNFSDKQPFIYIIFQITIMINVFFVVPLIQEVIKDKTFEYVGYDSQKDTKKLIKDLRKEINSELDNIKSDDFKNIRVTNRETPVFKSSSKKSGRIDYISSNKPVIILYKNKNWSLVVYKDKKSSEKNGWVFTKNLTK